MYVYCVVNDVIDVCVFGMDVNIYVVYKDGKK